MIGALPLFAALAMQAGPGTQVVVPAGDRLEVNINPRGGTITVEAWERGDIEVSGRHSDAIAVEVNPGATVEVHEVRPVRAALERTSYRIRVPSTVAVTVVSHDAQVLVRGIHASVDVNVNYGAIEVRDVVGPLSLDTTMGDLLVESSAGDATLDTTQGSITVRRLEGALEAETVGGDVDLADLRTRDVRVTSNSGAIGYSGALDPDGVLDLASQSGRIVVSVPATASATFEVGTMRGAFSTDFDLGATEPVLGETFSFAAGSGTARVAIITYSGDIRIEWIRR